MSVKSCQLTSILREHFYVSGEVLNIHRIEKYIEQTLWRIIKYTDYRTWAGIAQSE